LTKLELICSMLSPGKQSQNILFLSLVNLLPLADFFTEVGSCILNKYEINLIVFNLIILMLNIRILEYSIY